MFELQQQQQKKRYIDQTQLGKKEEDLDWTTQQLKLRIAHAEELSNST